MEKSSETNTIIIVIIIQQIHHHQQQQIQQEIWHYCHWIWRKIPYFDGDDYDNDDDDDDDDDDNAKGEHCNRVDNGQNRSFSMVSPVDFLTFPVTVLGLRFLFWANLFYFWMKLSERNRSWGLHLPATAQEGWHPQKALHILLIHGDPSSTGTGRMCTHERIFFENLFQIESLRSGFF